MQQPTRSRIGGPEGGGERERERVEGVERERRRRGRQRETENLQRDTDLGLRFEGKAICRPFVLILWPKI